MIYSRGKTVIFFKEQNVHNASIAQNFSETKEKF